MIGIGNRVDPVLDFCLRSPSHAQSLRFWNIIRSESLRGLLQLKSLGKDVRPNIVEAPLNEESYLKAVVLVRAFLPFAVVFWMNILWLAQAMVMIV